MGNPAAPVVQYREEYIASFEQNYSMLRVATTRETLMKGNQAVFLVSGSGGASAVTRGSNGQIPFKTVSNTQNTVTLIESHGPFEMTGFDMFANQGNQQTVMRNASQTLINRDMDQKIIDQLDTATLTTGTAVEASLDLVVKGLTILGNNEVDLTNEDKIFAAITPAFNGYLLQVKEYNNAAYVEVKPLVGPSKRYKRWAGVNWMVHPNLTGVGTSSEKCYMWHSDAIGHAANTGEMVVDAGYERKQQVSWTNATIYHNAKLLQNSGIIQMLHDGSRYVSG